MIKTYKIRLLPTKEQEELIWKHINCCRWVYNWGLGLSLDLYKNEGKSFSSYSLCNELTKLKKQEDYSWLKEVSASSLQRTLNDDLNSAYKNFFEKRGKYMKFKSKKKAKPSYPICQDRKLFRIEDNNFLIQKLGKVRFKTNYNLENVDKFSNPRIQYLNHKWILTVGVDCENQAFSLINKSMGIDLGVKELAVVDFEDENSIIYKNINKSAYVKKLERRLKHLQRKVSNKYTTNKNWNKTNNILKVEKQIADLQYHLSMIRKNYIHLIASELTNKLPYRITMEDLNVKGMMKNKHLSKAIQQENFNFFIATMQYKCNWKGIEFLQVPRNFPSSKTCSCCGQIKSDLKLSDRIYKCDCGLEIDRDWNAAINLNNYFKFN